MIKTQFKGEYLAAASSKNCRDRETENKDGRGDGRYTSSKRIHERITVAQRKNFKRRFPPPPSRSPFFPPLPPPLPRHTPARSLGKTPRDPSCLVLRMKGSVYPALRHSHKGKIQSLLGRDPSLPNPDPGSTLFPSSSRFSPSTHQPFPQPLFQPPPTLPTVSPVSRFNFHPSPTISLSFSQSSTTSSPLVPFFRSPFRLPWSTLGSCVLVRLSRACPPCLTFSTTARRVASPKATPSYKM